MLSSKPQHVSDGCSSELASHRWSGLERDGELLLFKCYKQQYSRNIPERTCHCQVASGQGTPICDHPFALLSVSVCPVIEIKLEDNLGDQGMNRANREMAILFRSGYPLGFTTMGE